MTTQDHEGLPIRSTCCPCGHDHSSGDITRRGFLQGAGGAAALGVALTGLTWSAVSAAEQDDQAAPGRRPLVVKPILVYSVPRRRHQTSWRSWGGIQTEQDAQEEMGRIRRELDRIGEEADFPVRFLPIVGIRGASEVSGLSDLTQADAFIVYAAGGGMDTFAKLAELGKDIIFFCRHKSGPVYLWYEIISPRYLRQHTDTLAVK
ncbi:MAG: twin-arginine translocation signal domain-containing protein, partial [Planctomycetota bacterium]